MEPQVSPPKQTVANPNLGKLVGSCSILDTEFTYVVATALPLELPEGSWLG